MWINDLYELLMLTKGAPLIDDLNTRAANNTTQITDRLDLIIDRVTGIKQKQDEQTALLTQIEINTRPAP
jgi:hypothetical protein